VPIFLVTLGINIAARIQGSADKDREHRDRRTLSVRGRCRLGPIEHAATFAVPEGPDRNQNEIDQGPNTERPECQQLNDTRSDFPEVKTMNAEHAHEETQ
jgi:hypothetical protein